MTETAPLLLQAAGDQAPALLALLRADPLLGARLLRAPVRDLHALAAWIQARPGAAPDAHPRALLASAIPGADPRLFRLLDRAALPAWPLADYRSLDALLRRDLLPEGPLTLEAIRRDAALLEEPEAVAHFLAAWEGPSGRQAAASLRRLVLAGGGPDPATLPRGRGLEAARRALRAALGRLRPRGFAPPALPGWEVLATVGAVWQAGRDFRNCLAEEGFGGWNLDDLLCGRTVFLRRGGVALAQLNRVFPGAWWPVQVAGPDNAEVPEAAAELSALLAARGLLAEGEAEALRLGSLRTPWEELEMEEVAA